MHYHFKAVGWDYVKDELVPCEDSNEVNVQFWHTSTCEENTANFDVENYARSRDLFCGVYVNGSKLIL